MRVLTISEANRVVDFGEMNEIQTIKFAVDHLAISDPDRSYITTTIDTVWLVVTLGASQEQRTIAYICEDADEVELAMVLMRTCKLAAREAKRLAVPEDVVAVYLG